jgi:hypothetical protein
MKMLQIILRKFVAARILIASREAAPAIGGVPAIAA